MSSAKFNYQNVTPSISDNSFGNPTFSDSTGLKGAFAKGDDLIARDKYDAYKNIKNWYGIDELARQDTMNLLNYQMKYNEYMTDKANEFNANQSATQYQRAMADMKSAGINPMVAFAGGASGLSNSASQSALGQSPGANAVSNSDSLLSKSTAKNINTFFNNLTKGKSDGDVTNILKLASILF